MVDVTKDQAKRPIPTSQKRLAVFTDALLNVAALSSVSQAIPNGACTQSLSDFAQLSAPIKVGYTLLWSSTFTQGQWLAGQ